VRFTLESNRSLRHREVTLCVKSVVMLGSPIQTIWRRDPLQNALWRL
jgi:hypothetical protein